MPTEVLLDVNVLVATVFADHPMHVTARRFVEKVPRFFTTPTTQGGFLRFATRPWKNERRQEQPPRLTMAKAQSKLSEFTQVAGHVFLPDDLSFVNLDARGLQGHRQWTDAYLLHLARRHGVSLVSCDSRISVLDDATRPVLFLLA